MVIDPNELPKFVRKTHCPECGEKEKLIKAEEDFDGSWNVTCICEKSFVIEPSKKSWDRDFSKPQDEDFPFELE